MSAVFDLKAKLSEMGLAPKKAFGQNFLVNQYVIKKIVASVESVTFTQLVEVGPGLGALTEPLLTHKPKLIEFDPELAEYWRKRGADVVEGDALQVDWTKMGLGAGTLLVSNTPYQISSGLVVERCLGPNEISHMVLMFQKEVAQRLTAKPSTKEYGFLSVMAQLHYKMAKVADCAPGDFFPAPKVASRVLRFERLPDPNLGLPFLKFVKQAFAQRRKFLLKNLKSAVNAPTVAKLPEIAAGLGISEKARAEELEPPQFVEFFKRLKRDRD